MKNIKRKIAAMVTLFPCLLSAANPDWINIHSDLYNGNVDVATVIGTGVRQEICRSHILENEAAKVIFKYEFYKMPARSYAFVDPVPVYSLIYKIQVQLQSSVDYKGGVGNLFRGNNPAYLNAIYLTSTFNGVSSLGTVKQYPTDGMSVLSCQADCDLTCTDSAFRNDNNKLNLETAGYGSGTGFMSTSYSVKVSDLMNVLPSSYTPKLTSLIDNDVSLIGSTLSLSTDYSYGWEPYRNGNSYSTHSLNDKYCGPQKGSAPYNFAFFGALNFESRTAPTSWNISLSMHTTHGSNVWLDSFTSSANISISN